MELELRFDKRQFNKIADGLLHIPGATQKATVSAINKVLPGMRTDASRAVAKTFFIKIRDVKATLSIRKASKNRIEGAVRSDGAAIPLIKFRVTPKSASKKRPKKGLMVRVKRGGGKRMSHSFVATMGSGHTGVFSKTNRLKDPPARKSGVIARKEPRKQRNIIGQRFGPAVPSMLKDTGAQATIQQQADDRLVKAADHEIYRILKGFGK